MSNTTTESTDDKHYTIEVWDLTFHLVDEDGNPKTDDDGYVEIYEAPQFDCSFVSDFCGLDIDDLALREVVK